MSIRNFAVATAILVPMGGAVTYSWQKSAKSQVLPLSPNEAKRTICSVHGMLLKSEAVPIIYGDVGFPEGYLDARQRTFPNANSTALGGCIVSKDSPKMQTVKFCPECREAEKCWGQSYTPKMVH